jgi:tetratricopeptide (TPR) repeat protein
VTEHSPSLPPDPASNDAYALFQRGQALLADQHWQQAVVSLEKAKRLEPDKTSIREALGRAYFHSGSYRDAAKEFSAVVERTPVNDYAHFCLGRSLQKLGDRRAARRHLKLACGMRPDREDYRRYLERVRAA